MYALQNHSYGNTAMTIHVHEQGWLEAANQATEQLNKQSSSMETPLRIRNKLDSGHFGIEVGCFPRGNKFLLFAPLADHL